MARYHCQRHLHRCLLDIAFQPQCSMAFAGNNSYDCFYHFSVRLLIGYTTLLWGRHINCQNKWFTPKKWETKLYRKLRLKKMKRNIPTWNPDNFSLQKRSYAEICRAMCQAEIVHVLNVIFSFLPLLFIIPWGSWYVFLLTSVLAAIYDMQFVLLQRFNRPRIERLLKKQSHKEN